MLWNRCINRASNKKKTFSFAWLHSTTTIHHKISPYNLTRKASQSFPGNAILKRYEMMAMTTLVNTQALPSHEKTNVYFAIVTTRTTPQKYLKSLSRLPLFSESCLIHPITYNSPFKVSGLRWQPKLTLSSPQAYVNVAKVMRTPFSFWAKYSPNETPRRCIKRKQTSSMILRSYLNSYTADHSLSFYFMHRQP